MEYNYSIRKTMTMFANIEPQMFARYLHRFRFSTRHFCHDLELGGGDLISSPVDSIASLVSPKKSYGPNSVGKKYFSATPFFTFSKNATGGHNA